MTPEAAAAEAGAPPTRVRTLRELEVDAIQEALCIARGHQIRAARLLGVTRWALQRRMRKYGIACG